MNKKIALNVAQKLPRKMVREIRNSSTNVTIANINSLVVIELIINLYGKVMFMANKLISNLQSTINVRFHQKVAHLFQ